MHQLAYRVWYFPALQYDEDQRDNVISAKLDGGYQLSDWAALGLGIGWLERSSADGDHPEIEYDDVTMHLSATFTY